jgi:Uma2 family endonuclease
MFAVEIPALSRADAAARWLELAPVAPEDGRPEMDQYAELILTPLPTNRHQLLCGQIARPLREQLGGTAIPSLAINTRVGVRVPDVTCTLTPADFAQDPAPAAAEICVEVASPGNTERSLLDKAAAYLDAGARESIIVELDGRVRFFDPTGERQDSSFGLKLSVPGL